MDEEELWAGVVGHSVAVSFLREAVKTPVHAYLFVGPIGTGTAEAARAFAGSLLAEDTGNDEASRHRYLAATHSHPDLVLIEPEGRSFLVADAKRVIKEGWRTPIESKRKVIVVDRFDSAEPEAAASLLKTIEEPPPTVVFVFLVSEVPDSHVTIASRCIRVDFPPLSDEILVQALVGSGVQPEDAAGLANASAGSLSRARLLADDSMFSARRDLWYSVPDRLDGTGASVAILVTELQDMIDLAQGPLFTKHQGELNALEEQEKTLGLRGSERRSLLDRHKREIRRLRDDELRFGLGTLSRRYLESVTNGDVNLSLGATEKITLAAGELIRNPNERLLLQALFLDLPSAPLSSSS